MIALLIGAVACVTALILSAWLMTFAKWFPIKGVDEFLIDYKTMIRAHIDYALMALFGLSFYGLGIPLPTAACVCLAIGGFTNPTIFTIAAFDTDFWSKKKWKVFTALSFVVSTIGFMWISFTILTYVINTL
ncbi:hypothetical protein ACKF11_12300 [Methylobacillus sp. Pita2]|uniref:hypothetical protein n=1 Tax=Methylobacillus TaxID=404 RepID=UPI002853E885|nr:hypothetical protein [Methylobacillus flagellatus]MDR5172438.1 hypothetical protein [Methylobacillus flagellatus]